MYLHLGNDTVIRNCDIIGIFDIENTSTGQITREFLNKNSNITVSVSYDMPKAFIVTENVNNKENKLYISHISVSTLNKRYKKISSK